MEQIKAIDALSREDILSPEEREGIAYLSSLGVDINFIYINTDPLLQAIMRAEYLDDKTHVYLSIFQLSIPSLKIIDVAKRIKTMKRLFHKNIQTYFFMLESRYHANGVMELWSLLKAKKQPEDVIWEVFSDVWVRNDFVMKSIPMWVLDDLFLINTNKSTQQEELKRLVNSDVVTIYRGEHCKSSQVEDGALSWTLDKEMAEWFATRFDFPEQRLIQVTIPINEVVAFLSTSEKEVIYRWDGKRDIVIEELEDN